MLNLLCLSVGKERKVYFCAGLLELQVSIHAAVAPSSGVKKPCCHYSPLLTYKWGGTVDMNLWPLCLCRVWGWSYKIFVSSFQSVAEYPLLLSNVLFMSSNQCLCFVTASRPTALCGEWWHVQSAGPNRYIQRSPQLLSHRDSHHLRQAH